MTKTNHQPNHDMNTPSQNPSQSNPHPVLKLGLDVDLKQITVTVQCDHQHPKPAMSFSVRRLVQWVQEKVRAGHRFPQVPRQIILTRGAEPRKTRYDALGPLNATFCTCEENARQAFINLQIARAYSCR